MTVVGPGLIKLIPDELSLIGPIKNFQSIPSIGMMADTMSMTTSSTMTYMIAGGSSRLISNDPAAAATEG